VPTSRQSLHSLPQLDEEYASASPLSAIDLREVYNYLNELTLFSLVEGDLTIFPKDLEVLVSIGGGDHQWRTKVEQIEARNEKFNTIQHLVS
jgi:hypothetical protein